MSFSVGCAGGINKRGIQFAMGNSSIKTGCEGEQCKDVTQGGEMSGGLGTLLGATVASAAKLVPGGPAEPPVININNGVVED